MVLPTSGPTVPQLCTEVPNCVKFGFNVAELNCCPTDAGHMIFCCDPDFDTARRSAYYVRVLENPSCRWSSWDAARNGTPPNPDMPSTIQERAWTSPVWYNPQD